MYQNAQRDQRRDPLAIGWNLMHAMSAIILADRFDPVGLMRGKIVGFDVDLMDAVATVLGLTPQYTEAAFDKIIPAIQAGTYNVGMSSFTDNKEREKTVDFVTYFSAGIQWAAPAGKTVDPNNACGLKVAVQSTTVEDTDEIPAKSKACTSAGKPAINKLKFDRQDDATNALVLGKVDAMSADSPVTASTIVWVF